MTLKSDFHDYYDNVFNNTGYILTRNSKSGLTKRKQFEYLKECGFLIPPVGKISDILGTYWEQEKQPVREVVAYEDETLHAGEGKILLSKFILPEIVMGDNSELYRLCSLFSSAFLGWSHERPSVSLRLLQVGVHQFWIEYRSNDSWMSNVGDGDIEIVDVKLNFGQHDKIKLPLYAIDFVIGKELYAVDFNIAPGTPYGLQRYLSPWKFVEALEEVIANININSNSH